MDELKICTKCDTEKGHLMFGWDSGGKYRRSTCLECSSTQAKDTALIRSGMERPGLDHVCPICSRTGHQALRKGPKSKNWSPWCCDHDHVTKQFRGWICHNCNTGLGLFKDNPETLTMAIKYLLAIYR